MVRDADTPDAAALTLKLPSVTIPAQEKPACTLVIVGCASGNTYVNGPPISAENLKLDLNVALELLKGALGVIQANLPVPAEKQRLVQPVTGPVALPPLPRRDS